MVGTELTEQQDDMEGTVYEQSMGQVSPNSTLKRGKIFSKKRKEGQVTSRIGDLNQ